jgi:hypothetical protein
MLVNLTAGVVVIRDLLSCAEIWKKYRGARRTIAHGKQSIAPLAAANPRIFGYCDRIVTARSFAISNGHVFHCNRLQFRAFTTLLLCRIRRDDPSTTNAGLLSVGKFNCVISVQNGTAPPSKLFFGY